MSPELASRIFYGIGDVSMLFWTVCAVWVLVAFAGDALLAGGPRGTLWRTALRLIAAASLLAIALIVLIDVLVFSAANVVSLIAAGGVAMAIVALAATALRAGMRTRARLVAIAVSIVIASLSFALLFPAGVMPRAFSVSDDLLERHARRDARAGVPRGDSVLVVEFGDFECPACAVAERQLANAFDDAPAPIDYQYRHFPKTDVHPNARAAAIASECAADQGRFAEVKRAFFSNQRQLEWLVHDAVWPGLDRARFESCRESPEPARRIAVDAADARALGVRVVPTIIIGRTAFMGVLPAAKLRARVAAEWREQRRPHTAPSPVAGGIGGPR